uniref:Uncharacterized protein n=1 Tax=Steinernema glaseri TaxID=37863 RepID=A0A1I7YVU2_9BILA
MGPQERCTATDNEPRNGDRNALLECVAAPARSGSMLTGGEGPRRVGTARKQWTVPELRSDKRFQGRPSRRGSAKGNVLPSTECSETKRKWKQGYFPGRTASEENPNKIPLRIESK